MVLNLLLNLIDLFTYSILYIGPNSHNFNKYNLESVLNIAADLLQIKSLNAQNGWPGKSFTHSLTSLRTH